jgi:hypothetical protein
MGECRANMEGFSILMLHDTAQRNSGHGVVYCLKTFLARAGLRKQQLHSTISWLVNVFTVASIMNCTH